MSNFANPELDTNVLRMILAAGTSALPSVVFSGDLTHGLYWTPNGLTLSGLADPVNAGDAASKHYVDSAGGVTYPLLAPDGMSSAPSYSFASAPADGLYYNGIINATCTNPSGIALNILGTRSLNFGTTSPSAGGFIQYDGTHILFSCDNAEPFEFSTPQVLIDDVTFPGTGSAPSIAFLSNPAVGFWYDASETNIVLSNDTTQPGFVIPQNCNLVFGASNYSASIFASYNSGTLEFFGAANGQILAMDTNTNANETRLLLWDITAATLQRVSIGAADSGGTGFRVLRIPN